MEGEMTLSLSLVLVIVAVLVWIYTLARRSRTPFTVDVLDAIFIVLLAFYFRA